MILLWLMRRVLYGPSPYLGCLNNKDLDDELKWLKKREFT